MGRFKRNLIRSNREVKIERAEMADRTLERAMKNIIWDLEAQRDQVKNIIDGVMDISTSNDRNTINTLDVFDGPSMASKMKANWTELRLINEQLRDAHDLYDFLFDDDEEIIERMHEGEVIEPESSPEADD